MQSLNRTNSFSFGLIAAILLITAGLVIGVSIPNIKAWQTSQVDRILAAAQESKNPAEKLNYHKQATLLGPDDPLAIERLAYSYWQVGEYGKSISTYQSSWIKINKLHLGLLGLKSNQPSSAKVFYNQSDRVEESAESQAGLASVAFIEARIDEGCNHAERAKKLNLSNPAAIQTGQVCAVLSNSSDLTERAKAYLLINNFIFDEGLNRLEAIASKTAYDWLLISRVYNNNGEYAKAIAAIDKGLLQDPASAELLSAKISTMQANGESDSTESYQQRLQDLKLEKFQK